MGVTSVTQSATRPVTRTENTRRAIGVCTRDNGTPASWCVLDERMDREVHAYPARWIAARYPERAPAPPSRRGLRWPAD